MRRINTKIKEHWPKKYIFGIMRPAEAETIWLKSQSCQNVHPVAQLRVGIMRRIEEHDQKILKSRPKSYIFETAIEWNQNEKSGLPLPKIHV